jgi:signal transduction histidine kinase
MRGSVNESGLIRKITDLFPDGVNDDRTIVVSKGRRKLHQSRKKKSAPGGEMLSLSQGKDIKRLQKFARRLMHAQEQERQRISRELHDDLGNRIAIMSMSLRRILKEFSENPGTNVNELGKVLDDVYELSTSLRNLSHELHPAALRWLGIPGALKSLDEAFRRDYGIDVDLVMPSEMPRLSEDAELCIFRITQESLHNAVKHSGAGKVRVVLQRTPRQTRLTVSDTGRGFVPSRAIQKGGLGLISMKERALSIGGRLTIVSSPKNGTEIRLVMPNNAISPPN